MLQKEWNAPVRDEAEEEQPEVSQETDALTENEPPAEEVKCREEPSEQPAEELENPGAEAVLLRTKT